ncbi:YbaN family protein [bacterium]|nr:YbaN family protein [bacterium]
MDPVRRGFLIAAGTLSLAVGVIALLIPVVPTTPFLLVAAACYIRSSQRFYSWLINHRWLGPPVRAYREEKGMTLWNKILTIATFWIANLVTALFIAKVLWLRIFLFAFASFMTWHVARLKTLR